MNVRVLHDGSWSYPGGSERVAREMARVLDCPITLGSMQDPEFWGGYDVDVLVNHSFNGIPRAVKDLYVGMKFRRMDFDEEVIISSGTTAKWWSPKPDQTHIHYCHFPSPGLYEADSNFISSAFSSKIAAIDQHYTDSCDDVLANSPFTAEHVEKHFDRDADVLNPPVDVDRFYHQNPSPDPYFVMIGRLNKMKRADVVARSFDGIDDARLVMIGDGPLRDECEANDGVTVYSDISDFGLRHVVAQSVGGIAFAEKEHCGLTPKEFQAAGKPVVVPDEPNLCNHVDDGETGVVVDANEAGVQWGVAKIRTTDWDHDHLQSVSEDWSTDNFHRKLREIVYSQEKKLMVTV